MVYSYVKHIKLLLLWVMLVRSLLLLLLITLQEHTDYNECEILYGKHELTQLLKVHNRLPIRPEGYMCLRCNTSSAWATNIPCTRQMYAIIGVKVIPKSTMNLLFKGSS